MNLIRPLQNKKHDKKAQEGAAKYGAKQSNKPSVKNDSATPSMRHLSSDPDRAVTELMQTVDHLREMHELESQALKHGDIQGFKNLQERKLHAAYQYQSDMQSLMQRADEIKAKASAQLLDDLKSRYALFQQSSAKTLDSMNRMDRIINRLSERLINAAKRAALQESVSYSANGSMQGKARHVVTTGVIETA